MDEIEPFILSNCVWQGRSAPGIVRRKVGHWLQIVLGRGGQLQELCAAGSVIATNYAWQGRSVPGIVNAVIMCSQAGQPFHPLAPSSPLCFVVAAS